MNREGVRVYINGDIRTMAGPEPVAPTAMACANGRFVATGSDAEILALASDGVEVVDLGGAVVVPGFIETHLHPMMWGLMLDGVDATPAACPTIDGLIEALAARAGRTPEGQLIDAWGFDDSLVADDRGLTVADLDRASTRHPVLVRHASAHAVYVNSAALAAAGITGQTPDPAGGVLIRAADGSPTGELREMPAMLLFPDSVPRMDLERGRQAMLRAQEAMARVGVTSFHDMFVTAEMYAAYRRLDADGDLRLRARLYLAHGVHDQLVEPADPTDHLVVGGVKLISDGSIQLHTAALTDPYQDLGGCHCGSMAIPPGRLDTLVAENHAAGRPVAIHTNGDQAIDFALDAIGRAQAAHPDQVLPHRLEHVQTLREDQIGRMSELGVAASIFVNHVYYWGDRHRDRFLGPARSERISPVASVAAADLPYGLHCDCPVTPVNPLFTMNTAVHRLTRNGELLGAEQRVTSYDALAGYTTAAARVTGEHSGKGTIAVGRLADFVVLDGDPLRAEPVELSGLRVMRTVVGGDTVFAA
ncbi:amidohydrolase [Streptomyces sp. NBC_00876]|uniref:amidohydrolase n=1 Tax=Streptomyces sp. NBC_00876 TaxID=2975853 RepID=UPI0038630EE4|nr:amidohydrolase [Streptomyces sp. NBC_00876]